MREKKEIKMSSPKKLTMLAFGLNAVLAFAAFGCATTQPSRELVDARDAYNRVRNSQAKDLVPAEVLSAKQALEQAEQSFDKDSNSPRSRDLAYLAQRRALLAEARGALAADERDSATAEKDIAQLRVFETNRAKAELKDARAVMGAQERQLTAEQRARREAEARAQAAIASLNRIAAVQQEARGMVITLNGAVLFATNQSVLLPIARDRLNQVAEALKESTDATFVVEGHTDSTGSSAVNDELSRRRAESVRTYLVEQGVDANRIRAVGLGPSRPVADNKSAEGRANNRRVEIVIEKKRDAQ